jgi:hypothetical protein
MNTLANQPRLFILLAASALIAVGCGDKPKAAEREAVPVVISTVEQKTVPGRT